MVEDFPNAPRARTGRRLSSSPGTAAASESVRDHRTRSVPSRSFSFFHPAHTVLVVVQRSLLGIIFLISRLQLHSNARTPIAFDEGPLVIFRRCPPFYPELRLEQTYTCCKTATASREDTKTINPETAACCQGEIFLRFHFLNCCVCSAVEPTTTTSLSARGGHVRMLLFATKNLSDRRRDERVALQEIIFCDVYCIALVMMKSSCTFVYVQ